MAKKRPGAFWQVNLYMLVWGVLQAVLTAPLLLWHILRLFDRAAVTQPDGSLVVELDMLELVSEITSDPALFLWLTLAGAASSIGAVLVVRRLAGGPVLLDLGLHRRPGWRQQLLLGLALGPLAFLAILGFELLAGWAEVGWSGASAGALAASLLAFTLVAVAEEVMARGFLLQVIERSRGTKAAVLLSSLIWSLLHALNPGASPMALLIIALAGLLFGYAYVLTRQLWLPIGFHLSWNFAEGPIYGFPVSGLSSDGLLQVTLRGPVAATGGAFGPEEGAVMLLGLAVTTGVILLWRRRAAPGRTALAA